MASVYKCDRCGEIYTEKTNYCEARLYNKDLCPECQRQIQMWFDGEVTFIRKFTPRMYAKLSKVAEPLIPDACKDKKKTMNPGEIAKYCLSDVSVTMHSLRYIVNEAIDNTLKWAWTTSVDEMDRVMKERGLEVGDDDDNDEECF